MLYNAIVSDPAPVLAAMHGYDGGAFSGEGVVYLDLAAAPGLNRWDYDLIDLKLRETLSNGSACMLDVQLRHPEAGFLVASGGKYLLIWTDSPAPAGKGRVLGFGRIVPLPSSVGNSEGKVGIDALCRPEAFQRAVHVAMKAAVPFDPEFYDQESGPSTMDLISCSSLVPVIDRRTHGVFVRKNHAAMDVVVSRPPGNVAANGIIAYDVTDHAARSGFDIRRAGSEEPIWQIATKIQVAWNQYAAGTCDLGPIIQIGVFGNGNAQGGQLYGFSTFTPTEFKNSFPKPGAALGTGWIARVSNLVSRDRNEQYFRSTAEPAVAAAIANDFDTLSTTGTSIANNSDGRASVTVPISDMGLAAGSNNGMVGWYDYHQARRETLTMISTLGLDGRLIPGLPEMTGAKTVIADPTTIQTGQPWLPGTPYAEGDDVWFGGLHQESLVDHVSGTQFDQTKWISDPAPPQMIESNIGVYVWQPNTYYTAQFCVRPDPSAVTFWYRNKEGYSTATTWLSDQNNWTQGPPPKQAMSTESARYLSSDRGVETINHLDQRQYAAMLSRAKCMEAVFRMRFDKVLDAATDFRAMDVSVGTVLRVRTGALTSGITEIIGVVTSFEMTMQKGGGGAVSVSLGLIPGTGLDDPTTDATLGAKPAGYKFGEPRTPVLVELLWNYNYSCLLARRVGASEGTQRTIITNAINSNTGGDPGSFATSFAAGLNAVQNRAEIVMRDLVQEGMIALVHPTMKMKKKPAPRNVGFAS